MRTRPSGLDGIAKGVVDRRHLREIAFNVLFSSREQPKTVDVSNGIAGVVNPTPAIDTALDISQRANATRATQGLGDGLVPSTIQVDTLTIRASKVVLMVEQMSPIVNLSVSPEIKVEPAQVTINVPPYPTPEKRTLVIRHEDGTESIVSES